jgi:predicted DNA-binding protein (MmcQ/YjbR family)
MGAKTRISVDPLSQLRTISLEFPEAVETFTFGDPVFRVRNKIFAMYRTGDGGTSLWCKAAVGVQEDLVRADPKQFFRPPYVGPKGWIGVRLGKNTDWNLVAHLVEQSYALIAPKKLSKMLETD